MYLACKQCGKRPTIVCSDFGLFEEAVIERGECEHQVFRIEDLLQEFDFRTVCETLALYGFYVPRSQS